MVGALDIVGEADGCVDTEGSRLTVGDSDGTVDGWDVGTSVGGVVEGIELGR